MAYAAPVHARKSIMNKVTNIAVAALEMDNSDIVIEIHVNEEITKEIIRLKETAIQDMLIKLGWTPPKGE